MTGNDVTEARPASAGATGPKPAADIVYRRISKTYGGLAGSVDALRDVTFTVKPRELVSIVGPSGCGKTTVLRMTAGLTRASEGEVLVGGDPIVGPRVDVGVMFQSPVLLSWRTVLDNVMILVELRGKDPSAHRARARELLDLVGLRGFAAHQPHQLSGGMQQRVALARTLLLDPAILLMDEPFGALDDLTREDMNIELERIWRTTHKTGLLVTHNIAEAVYLSDRVVVMSARPGRVQGIVDVRLPRPRPFEIRYENEFGALLAEVHALIRRDAAPTATRGRLS
jgi:NitT/TauT family transport system ATP-binding protein